jgi:hypothetical protein
MLYGSTLLATSFGPDPWQVRLIRLLLFFIPRASPDHEPLYRFIRKWYLEVDESGVPTREIGLGSEGRALFGAPDGRNVGFWTDSSKTFQEDELIPIAADEFERLWHDIHGGTHSGA